MPRTRRILTAFLSLALFFSMLPATALAAAGPGTEPAAAAQGQAAASKKTLTGTYKDASGSYSPRYTPYIRFSRNGTFTFRVNLYEGMGTIKGTYKRSGSSITCRVKSRDFNGFTGDKVKSFKLTLKNEKTITYKGSRIGSTTWGTTFKKK